MRGSISVPLVAMLACLLLALPAHAAPGDLDPQFGNGGIALIGGSGSDLEFAEIHDMAVAPDGKIVIAGGLAGPLSANAFVLRLLPNGSPDPDFGSNGLFLSTLGNSSAIAWGVAVRPDGRVVIAGEVTSSARVPVIARITNGGQLDTTFAPASAFPGAFFADFLPADAVFTDVSIQPSGKVVTSGGRLSVPRIAFAERVTEGGAFDSTYNSPTGYFYETFHAAYSAESMAMAIRPDGRTVHCGYGAGDTTDTVSLGILARTEAGLPDPVFGGPDGKGIFPQGGPVMNDSCRGVALQPDGKAVAAGVITSGGSSSNAVVSRVTESGQLDAGFANAGTLIETRGDQVSFANDVVVDASGRIIVVGRARYDEKQHFGIWGYLPSGAPDLTFGDAGYAGRELAGSGWAETAVLTANGRLIVVGHTASSIAALSVKLSDDPAAPVIPTATARIKSPGKSRLRRRNLKAISGTATGVGAAVAKVEIALIKLGPRKSKRCVWLRSGKPSFRKVRRPRAGCKTQRWITAKGTTKWSLKLKRGLPAGKYKVYARATPVGGLPQSRFSRAAGNYRGFTLKR